MSEQNPKNPPTSHDIVAELRPEGVFSHVHPADLEPLKFYGTFHEHQPGEIVIEEGAVQDRLFYIVHGSADVIVKYGGVETLLGKISSGDCFGEISVFEPGPTSATVRIAEISVLWSIDVNSLQAYFEKLPAAGGQVMLGLAQLLSKRLRNANKALIEARMLPKHLAVRSGKVAMPITPESVEKECGSSSSGGLISSLFGKSMGTTKRLK